MIKDIDVLVIGSNVMDLISYVDRLPHKGETVEAPSFEMGFGGKGANQAVAASRLGARVAMLTCVGNDNFGVETRANFVANHIDISGVLTGHQSNGVAPIFVESNGDNRILVVQGANTELTPEVLLDKIDLIKRAKVIVLQQEVPMPTNIKAIHLAKKYNIPIIYNPAPAHKLPLDVLPAVDYLIPNESELTAITKMPVSTVQETKAAARRLLSFGVANVIVTMGDRGALWITAGQEATLVDGQDVNAIDTTGAGDAFVGAFAHYFARGESLETAIIQANAYAALSVMTRGTQKSYPSVSHHMTKEVHA
ncbi:ribokinase [Leuconostoc pseudomesenteroides]|jgi:ribokinase|uniref:ribokinase n=1 Tax=Leuconostoc TaxID=1243 RepID=UPI0011DDD484|nr:MULTISPECIES: ribokinase [Leuconostoc]MBK0041199.1 ribokinase [Leuconostoc sp. S51]MBK0052224.1 ribokinase [Leuconostoc sp. S50]MBS0957962.1 ribokinase [Leuconostoc pseudomesenteroides]MCT4380359.1 ribokinase [Leuconostoc pseudomesenteroides]MCT4412759.1 ribokinase [Leuconostoc pseudomesenteroides]